MDAAAALARVLQERLQVDAATRDLAGRIANTSQAASGAVG